MRKEPLIFNIESKNKPILEIDSVIYKKITEENSCLNEIFNLNMIEPFGMYIISKTAFYTTEELWENKKGLYPDYGLFKFAKDILYICYDNSDFNKSYYVNLDTFIEALSSEEKSQIYLNMPELSDLIL